MKTEVIDFGDVPKEIRKGGGGTHIPPGDYLAKIVKADKAWKDNDKSNPPYFRWQIQVIEGKHKGSSLYLTTSLKREALFNLRNLIFAATDGKKNVAGQSAFKFTPDKIYGRVIGITVDDNVYQKDGKDKISSQVVDTFPKSEFESEDEEETEEEEEVEEEDEDELDDVDVDDDL
jgi:hypothetical protein